MLVQMARGVVLKCQIPSRCSGIGGARCSLGWSLSFRGCVRERSKARSRRIRSGEHRQKDASQEDEKNRQYTQIKEG
jgi:hypothetical protein